jgi:hypothetical protein
MCTLVESLRSKAAEAQQAFRELVGMVANSQAVDEDEAAAILRDAGRTADDLQQEVNRFHRAAGLRATIAKIESEQAATKAEQSKLGARLEQARKERFALEREIQQGENNFRGLIAVSFGAGQRADKMKAELRELEGVA